MSEHVGAGLFLLQEFRFVLCQITIIMAIVCALHAHTHTNIDELAKQELKKATANRKRNGQTERVRCSRGRRRDCMQLIPVESGTRTEITQTIYLSAAAAAAFVCSIIILF